MKPTTIVVLAVVIVVAGTWSQGKPLTQKQIAGAIVALLFFAVLEDSAPGIAKPFGWLILATVTGNYADDLFGRIASITGATTPAAQGPVNDAGKPMFPGKQSTSIMKAV